MKKFVIPALVILAFVLAVPSTSMAKKYHGHGYKGGHGYKSKGYGYKHGYKHAYKHGYNRGYKRGYYKPYYKPYYRPYYKPYYKPYYGPAYYPAPYPVYPYIPFSVNLGFVIH